jgi:penicillin-binding protein-related factor A (putative recombinase)
MYYKAWKGGGRASIPIEDIRKTCTRCDVGKFNSLDYLIGL